MAAQSDDYSDDDEPKRSKKDAPDAAEPRGGGSEVAGDSAKGSTSADGASTAPHEEPEQAPLSAPGGAEPAAAAGDA